MFERNQIDELRKEIQIMTLSRHQNLLPVYGSFVNGPKLFIVTPFLVGGSCLDIMKSSSPHGFDEVSIATILKQALQGLDYLHRNGLIHRDVKAGNLLLDKDGLVQLADFGVSSSLMDSGERRGQRKTFVGTPCWMAPEVMEQSGYDYKADIWSFGITAIELANGHAPYAKFPPLKVLMLTLQNDPPTLDRETDNSRFSRAFKEMIDSCLKKDPSKRPSADKLLQHPFFRSAKRSTHLVTSIISHMVPITERQHLYKPVTNAITVIDEESHEWDFDEQPFLVPSPPANLGDLKSVSFADTQPPLIVTASNLSSSPTVVSDLPTDMDMLDKKKSRFVVDGLAIHDSGTDLAPPAIMTATTGEVRKGRFSVLESAGNSPEIEPALATQQYVPADPLPTSTLDRKMARRFEVQTTINEDADVESRTSLQLEQSKIEPPYSPQNGANPFFGSGDRRGRFEISSGTSVAPTTVTVKSIPPLSTVLAPIPTEGSMQQRNEALTKLCETQRQMVLGLVAILEKNGLSPFVDESSQKK